MPFLCQIARSNAHLAWIANGGSKVVTAGMFAFRVFLDGIARYGGMYDRNWRQTNEVRAALYIHLPKMGRNPRRCIFNIDEHSAKRCTRRVRQTCSGCLDPRFPNDDVHPPLCDEHYTEYHTILLNNGTLVKV